MIPTFLVASSFFLLKFNPKSVNTRNKLKREREKKQKFIIKAFFSIIFFEKYLIENFGKIILSKCFKTFCINVIDNCTNY
jgi:hypothetical protein